MPSESIAFDVKEQVRQAVDIVDLVGSYLQVHRQGHAYKALCPWHNDTRPSLQINQERQSYRCFVCDLGGDVFSFVMKMEGVEFPEALAMLADRAGISLAVSPQRAALADEKRVLFQAMAWAEEQYHRCLLGSSEAASARAYLKDRGISDDSVKKFRLGFAPDGWTWIQDQARGTRFDGKLLETLGLVIPRRQGGGFYDRFRGRVLFSIRDSQGRSVGMGGRVLPGQGDEAGAKYINSPETPLFTKNSLLYGLDAARESVTRSRTVVVMEGYTDCIMAHQCGFTEAVAVLGTALGENHLPLLRRYADQIVLVLDGDDAGRRRANQILEMFVSRQVDLKILTLPEQLDPADYLLKFGAEAFRGLLSTAVDALEHKLKVTTEGLGTSPGLHAVHQAVEEILGTLSRIPSSSMEGGVQLREEQILHRIGGSFSFPVDRLRQRLKELRGTARRPADVEKPVPVVNTLWKAEQMDPWERELLEVLLQYPQGMEEVLAYVRQEDFAPGAGAEIFSICCRIHEEGFLPTPDRLLLSFDEPSQKNLLVELEERGRAKVGRADPSSRLQEWLRQYRFKQEEQDARHHAHALREGKLDHDKALQLLDHIIQSKRTRQGISGPTDG